MAYEWQCGACSGKVNQISAHICKWCGVEVHSSIMCPAVLCRNEGDYFCTSPCEAKWKAF
jgi:hypothetical protein